MRGGLVAAMGRRRFAPIDPRLLFAAGEEGAWYDPNFQAGLFQDAFGNTPVTASGQPVGLMIDRRISDAPFGAEKVVNGAFTTNSDWTSSGGWAISGGTADGTVTTSNFDQPMTLTAGKTYRCEFTVSNLTTGSVRLSLTAEGADSTVGTTRSANGNYIEYLRAATGADGIRLDGVTSFTGSVDNVSVKEALGNHAIQATSTARPTFETDGLYRWLSFDGVDDYMQVPSSQARFKYLHDGTGQTVWAAITVAGALFHPIVSTTNSGNTANTGYQMTKDDRTASRSNNTVSGGASPIVHAQNISNPPYAQPLVMTQTDALNRYTTRQRGVLLQSDSSEGSLRSAANSSFSLTLGASGSLISMANMKFYGAVIRNRVSSAAQISGVEQHLAGKAGVYF